MRFNRKPSRIFYGWWIVVASFLIALYVGGAVFYGFTAIFEPIANEFGWSYTQISFAASLRGLEMGLLAPIIGLFVDRWGPRRLIASGAAIGALGLILLSRTTSLAMFYGAFFLVAMGTSCCTMTVLMTAIANWFRKNVGLASGIALSGFGCGGLLIPVIVGLIDMYDWRITVTILGLGMFAMVLPLSLLFRHKPEQYGSLPDGEVKDAMIPDDGAASAQTVEVSLKAKAALKTRAFWHMAVAYTCHTLILSAIITHVMPYLSSIGVARSRSSLVATIIPLMSIGGRLGLGWLGDRTDKKRVLIAAFAMIGLGMLCFGYASAGGTWLLIPFLVLFGIGYGGSNALRPSLLREYFGRANFGTIFGLIIGINMMGGIIGPTLAGWSFDNWGSYHGIWFVFAGLAIAALTAVFTMPPVRVTAKVADKA